MQLRHLRYFVAVADAGTISAAADLVHVTQPALSRQLRQLEDDLGVTLFDRTPGRVSLNRTGRALLPQARELLAGAAKLRSAAAYHARGGVERVEIVAPTVTLTDVVAPFVATMDPGEPVVDVRIGDGLTTAEMLGSGADLAIGTDRPPPPFDSLVLADLHVWAYVHAADSWSGRDAVPIGELVTRPLVRVPPTFAARASLDAVVAERGLSYPSCVDAANGTIAQALAAAGRGVAVVSDDARFGLVPVRVDVDGSALRIRLHAAWDPRAAAAETLEAMARRLAGWLRQRYAPPRGTAAP